MGTLATQKEESKEDSTRQLYDNLLDKASGKWHRQDMIAVKVLFICHKELWQHIKRSTSIIQPIRYMIRPWVVDTNATIEDLPFTMLLGYNNSLGVVDEQIDEDTSSGSFHLSQRTLATHHEESKDDNELIRLVGNGMNRMWLQHHLSIKIWYIFIYKNTIVYENSNTWELERREFPLFHSKSLKCDLFVWKEDENKKEFCRFTVEVTWWRKWREELITGMKGRALEVIDLEQKVQLFHELDGNVTRYVFDHCSPNLIAIHTFIHDVKKGGYSTILKQLHKVGLNKVLGHLVTIPKVGLNQGTRQPSWESCTQGQPQSRYMVILGHLIINEQYPRLASTKVLSDLRTIIELYPRSTSTKVLDNLGTISELDNIGLDQILDNLETINGLYPKLTLTRVVTNFVIIIELYPRSASTRVLNDLGTIIELYPRSTSTKYGQFLHNPSNFSFDGQPILQSSGFTPLLYATTTAYITLTNPFYINLQASVIYPSHCSSIYCVAYPSYGYVPLVDGATSSSFTPQASRVSSTQENISRKAEMIHANKFLDNLDFLYNLSFGDLIYMKYHRQPFLEGYGVSSHLLAPRASVGAQICPLDS
ncbi:Pumilio-like 6, chloroplastic, partial [Mucuna pruriens]